jgi:hypothetical protein
VLAGIVTSRGRSILVVGTRGHKAAGLAVEPSGKPFTASKSARIVRFLRSMCAPQAPVFCSERLRNG